MTSLAVVCTRAPQPVCRLLDLMPTCYSRSIELANTVIFQVGNCFISLCGLAITYIMMHNIRKKYTAVGRKEMLSTFIIYWGLSFFSLCLDSGVIKSSNPSFPYFVSLQLGLSCGLCWSLCYNGLLAFQLWEDGTKVSLWILYTTNFIWILLCFLITLFTVQEKWSTQLGVNNVNPLFVICYILPLCMLIVYFVSQFILVVFVLGEGFALGILGLMVFFFAAGQILVYGFSSSLCIAMNHYLDGMFFASLCNLVSIMMVYKLWDSLTTEDLEFSVGMKQNAWDLDQYHEY